MSLYVRIKKKLGNFDMDVEFSSGNETVALLGESGSGKTMTLKCIAGIEVPDEGEIILNDRVLFDSKKGINVPPRKRKVGILFQNYALFPNMTVEGNIAIGMREKSDLEKKKKVSEMIDLFCLNGLEKKHPLQLSGGQQQRVATARMLASDPDIIMLDEPFSALDSHLRWKLEMQLTDDLSRFKGSVILVSHNRDEAYRMSNKIIVIKNGRCMLPMDKEEFFEDPHTVAAAIVSGCKNIMPVSRIDEHHVKVIPWNVELETHNIVSDKVSSIGIRSHLITTEFNVNAISCTVQKVIESPFEFSIILSVDAAASHERDNSLYWEIDKSRQTPMVGDRISLFIPDDHILLLVS
jgi:molybdate transport system ATP-binding protein